jgi:hypothetical protein
MTAARMTLLTLWVILSAGWAVAMAQQLRLGDAVDTYRSYYQKVNDINDGIATSAEKQAYMNSGPELEYAGKRFFLFFLIGLGLPFAVLQGGKHLMKPKDPKAAAKKN